MWRWREIARSLVDVDSKDGRKKIGRDLLTVSRLATLAAFISKRNIQISVRPEVEIACIVIGESVRLIDNDLFAVNIGNFAIRRRNLETRQSIETTSRKTGILRRIEDIKIAVGREIWMKGQSQKPLLTARDGVAAQVQERARGSLGRAQISQQSDDSQLFDNEETIRFTRRRRQRDCAATARGVTKSGFPSIACLPRWILRHF